MSDIHRPIADIFKPKKTRKGTKSNDHAKTLQPVPKADDVRSPLQVLHHRRGHSGGKQEESGMNPQHTPTPWKRMTEDGLVIQGPNGENVGSAWSDKMPNCSANAAFIVLAVNAHEAQEKMIRVAVKALTELAKNPNRKDVDLYAQAALDTMKDVFGGVI